MERYTHLVNIVFIIPSGTSNGSDITYDMVKKALRVRLAYLDLEAAGSGTDAFDTYVRNEVIEFEDSSPIRED